MDYLKLFTQQTFFNFLCVDGKPELNETYKLRYQVYCLERSFLSPDEHPAGSESDTYDAHAEHFSAYDRHGEIAGSVRLVRRSPELGYPFQEHCPVFSDAWLPPDEAAQEISRLVVSKQYRRRQGDNWLGIPDENPLELPEDIAAKRGGHPIIVLGLYREIYRYSKRNGIRYWYAAMERSLARLLSRYGFDFKPIGPKIDYYGPVTIYLASLADLEASVSNVSPQLYEWFTSEL
ncbi:MAG: PEP-CTERM/exosortase system-associated acyltransferase [Pseudomonadota bacterium]|nr:PEP-CTERM/exosortase system-associated acyltransferase [Pseudomonadota bacterium]